MVRCNPVNVPHAERLNLCVVENVPCTEHLAVLLDRYSAGRGEEDRRGCTGTFELYTGLPRGLPHNVRGTHVRFRTTSTTTFVRSSAWR